MKYEISDNVRENILKLVNRCDIKGGEAFGIVEIIQTLSKPAPEKKKKEEKKKGKKEGIKEEK